MRLSFRRARKILAALGLAICIAGCAHHRDGTLSQDEAYLLVKLRYDGDRPIALRFYEHSSKDQFSVRSGNLDPQLILVKSGVYYASQVTTTSSKMMNPNLFTSDGEPQAIQVPAGSLVYIGDWYISGKSIERFHWDFEVSYENETPLRIAEKYNWIQKLPLKVSMSGKPAVNVTWD